MNRNGIFIAAGLAVMGLLLGIFIYAAARAFVDRDRQVTVRGLATREVMANKVTWPIVYKLVGNDLQGIYAQFEANNKVVSDYLTGNGLSDSEISVSAPDITDYQAENYGQQKPYRYALTAVTTVTSAQVDLVRTLINRQGQLLKKGIAVTAGDWNYRTAYEYTGLNEIKPEMIAEATAAARTAADKFAQDSQSEVGRLLRASQGQFTIDDRDPYTPYIKEVRVVTSLTYAIK